MTFTVIINSVKAEEDEAEFKAAFEEVQAETLNLLSDTQDQNEFELIERMCDTFEQYKTFFARGAELIGKLEPTYEKFRAQSKKVCYLYYGLLMLDFSLGRSSIIKQNTEENNTLECH